MSPAAYRLSGAPDPLDALKAAHPDGPPADVAEKQSCAITARQSGIRAEFSGEVATGKRPPRYPAPEGGQ